MPIPELFEVRHDVAAAVLEAAPDQLDVGVDHRLKPLAGSRDVRIEVPLGGGGANGCFRHGRNNEGLLQEEKPGGFPPPTGEKAFSLI
jgi:hypothetical protein